MCVLVFFFKQKTAYEMRISDWSSDVCSSDLGRQARAAETAIIVEIFDHGDVALGIAHPRAGDGGEDRGLVRRDHAPGLAVLQALDRLRDRSEEHTSELQSIMRT